MKPSVTEQLLSQFLLLLTLMFIFIMQNNMMISFAFAVIHCAAKLQLCNGEFCF